jgi:DnaJ-class molecular chaperone
LGDTLSVTTLEGQRYELTLPGGSQPQQKRRLKGQGLPYRSGGQGMRGDLYVQPSICIPTEGELTPELRAVFEQLKQLQPSTPPASPASSESVSI